MWKAIAVQGMRDEVGENQCEKESRTKDTMKTLKQRKRYTPADHDTIRRMWDTHTLNEIASAINGDAGTICTIGHRLGLARTKFTWTDEADVTLRKMHARKCSDTEIAEAVGCDRKCVGRRRKDLGLPRICGRKGDKWPKQLRIRFKASVKAWLAKHQVETLAELRVKKFREFATESGWPTDLPVRCTMILNLLAAHGVPMHRRQICEGIGLTWHGSRRSMKCKGEHGSYLAILVARGLVVRLGRVVITTGKGKSVYLYSLGPDALRILQERANGQQN